MSENDEIHMTFTEAHEWEDILMGQFKKKFPDKKIPYFGSTWKAIDWLKEKVYESDRKDTLIKCLKESDEFKTFKGCILKKED